MKIGITATIVLGVFLISHNVICQDNYAISEVSPTDLQDRLLEKQQQAKLDQEAARQKEENLYIRMLDVSFKVYSQLKDSGVVFEPVEKWKNKSELIRGFDEGKFVIGQGSIRIKVPAYFCPKGLGCIELGGYHTHDNFNVCQFTISAGLNTISSVLPDRLGLTYTSIGIENTSIGKRPCESFTDEDIDEYVKVILNGILIRWNQELRG